MSDIVVVTTSMSRQLQSNQIYTRTAVKKRARVAQPSIIVEIQPVPCNELFCHQSSRVWLAWIVTCREGLAQCCKRQVGLCEGALPSSPPTSSQLGGCAWPQPEQLSPGPEAKPPSSAFSFSTLFLAFFFDLLGFDTRFSAPGSPAEPALGPTRNV